MERKPSIPKTSKTETPETCKEPKKETETQIEPKSESESQPIDLFKSYMQCFLNKSNKNIKGSKKWEELMKQRKFWDTQPVIKVGEVTKTFPSGPLKKAEDHNVSKENVKLPAGFTWREIDLNDETDISDLYTLLYENYVEDDEGNFRFNYSKQFLKWALMPPGYHKDLYFGLMHTVKGKDIMVGFISGIILNTFIEKEKVKLTEVNFLCVKKEYRKFSMASVLIREVVRRSNMKGVFQGLFTSGTMLPTPFAQTRYWHRSLNPVKLIKVISLSLLLLLY